MLFLVSPFISFSHSIYWICQDRRGNGQLTSFLLQLGQNNKKSCLVVLHRSPLFFWKLEKKFLLYRSIPHLIFRIPKVFFFFENFDLLEIFLSCCFQLVYILILVLNLYKDIFGKVDLFAPLLGDTEAIIPCSFDFDLKKKKKNRLPAPSQKKLRTTTIFFLGLTCVFQPNQHRLTKA